MSDLCCAVSCYIALATIMTTITILPLSLYDYHYRYTTIARALCLRHSALRFSHGVYLKLVSLRHSSFIVLLYRACMPHRSLCFFIAALIEHRCSVVRCARSAVSLGFAAVLQRLCNITCKHEYLNCAIHDLLPCQLVSLYPRFAIL